MKRILILLSNGFEVYEAASFIDVFGWANTFGSEKLEIVTAGFHSRLTCAFGFQAVPEAQINKLDLIEFDALAIPGGFEQAGFYEDAYSENFLNTVRFFNQNKKIIAALCVGALPLGKSGILKNRKATTYHLLEGKRRRQLADMGATVLDKSIVVDENIITSSSPATALDVAFLLLEKLTSKENTDKIKTLMGFNNTTT